MLERLSQRALGEEARDGLRVHRVVEQLVAAAAASLGAVHGRVGVAQQVGGAVGRPVRERDADARARRRPRRARARTGATSASSARCASSTACASSRRCSQITTNSSPPNRATVSSRRTEPTRRRPTATSSSSPVSWPKPVVDHLEPVEVEEERRDDRAALGQRVQRGVEALDAERAVGERRERVVQREEAELLGVRGAVEREDDEVARTLEHAELARRSASGPLG